MAPTPHLLLHKVRKRPDGNEKECEKVRKCLVSDMLVGVCFTLAQASARGRSQSDTP